MHHFDYTEGRLHAEGVPLARLAQEVGTPAYVYSRATLTRHFRVVDAALSGHPHLVCFAVKANSNLAVLGLLAELGAGFDIVSGGELARVLKAGGDPAKVTFSGVGKTEDELTLALEAGVRSFNVESEGELEALDRVAGRLGKRAPVSLRVNPDVDPKTHPYIATGLEAHKFGIPRDRARALYGKAAALGHLEVCGVDCHIGSQLTDLSPFVDAAERMLELVRDLRADGHPIRHLDMGGGLGIPYDGETPPLPDAWGAALKDAVAPVPDLELVVEPGRVIAGNAGILLTRVLYLKETGRKTFVIVDAGMNDLARPSLYQAHHAIWPVDAPAHDAPEVVCDVVGPVCESGDFFARDRALPKVRAGDLVAVMSAGAYGFTMASNYNSRPRPPEVLVDGGDYLVVRRRESIADLMRGERTLTGGG